MQDVFDGLFEKSTQNHKFRNLIALIASKENILLAYRNIKKNKGSMTRGTDQEDITKYKNASEDEIVAYFQKKLQHYKPKSVRRVYIPKPNGDTRPLGIPCIDDRIIQQCIKQILEPICEAKFYHHSYGFRPNRAVSHAIARSMTLMNKCQLHYVVDIDIKGFFDNVNHKKLKKQLWHMGIQDKRLLMIIGKILSSEIEGEGKCQKGVPQGGIISPLLSNIALNELDWWVSSQWETYKTKHDYSYNNKYRAIRKTKLKEIYLVRYADDAKIFCRDYQTAQKMYHATVQWLKERLGLEISKEKSKITNVRKNRTEFLGFSLKVKLKKKKYICQSNMTPKAVQKTIKKLKDQIKEIQRNTVTTQVNKLNAMILGSHNYYNCATNVNLDFGKINFLVTKSLDIRLRNHISDKPKLTKTYLRLYGEYQGKIRTICKVSIFPIYGCRTKPPMNFTQTICNYTEEGRKEIHRNLRGYEQLITYLLNQEMNHHTMEYYDNRISLMVGQQGKCHVTGKYLKPNEMACHHKRPKEKGGTDEYSNLVWLNTDVHKLVHSTKIETIQKYKDRLKLDEKGLKRVNALRKLVGNLAI